MEQLQSWASMCSRQLSAFPVALSSRLGTLTTLPRGQEGAQSMGGREKDQGVPAGCNTGVTVCTPPVVGFWDTAGHVHTSRFLSLTVGSSFLSLPLHHPAALRHLSQGMCQGTPALRGCVLTGGGQWEQASTLAPWLPQDNGQSTHAPAQPSRPGPHDTGLSSRVFQPSSF